MLRTAAILALVLATPAVAGSARDDALGALAGIVNDRVICHRDIDSARFVALVDQSAASFGGDAFRTDLAVAADALLAEQRRWTAGQVSDYCDRGASILVDLGLL